MNIIEVMEARRSVRSYDGKGLTPEQCKAVEDAVSHVESPFGGTVMIKLVKVDSDAPVRPGTYGVIKGALNYLVMGIGDDEASALSAGYTLQQVVLKATEMGLGTCWLAATFRNGPFVALAAFPETAPLKIVCPIGMPAEKLRLMEKIMRKTIGSDGRQPAAKLFFIDGTATPLPAENTFMPSLLMLRLAPSSTNSQPWRAVVAGDTVHFFSAKDSRVSTLDVGIGLCQFVKAEEYYGHGGLFVQQPEQAALLAPDWRYLTSYTRI